MYTTKITVDLSGRFPPDLVYAKQGDVAARQVEVSFLDNGVVYTIPQGTTARIRVTKPDKTYVFNDCTISGNVVTAPLTAQTLAAAGEALADIALYQGEDVLLSCSCFRLMISPRAGSDNAAESSDEFGALDKLLQEAETSIPAATEAAEEANAAAGAANSAANTANTAANSANSAATAANSAANAANTAADAANEAADAANEAAEAANEAADAANAAAGGEISSKIISFVEAEIRENIQSGETTAEIAGKIQKWLSDLEVYLTGVTGPVQERIYVSGNVLYIPGESAE